MFFIKRSKVKFDFIGIDIHNHILPGIDDGSSSTDNSFELMQELSKMGFNALIPTPHTYPELYPNTPESIKNA